MADVSIQGFVRNRLHKHNSIRWQTGHARLSVARWARFSLQGCIVAGIASICFAEPETCDAHAKNMPLPEFLELVGTNPTEARSHVECGRVDVTGKLVMGRNRFPVIMGVLDSYLRNSRSRSELLKLLTAMFKAGADPNAAFQNKPFMWVALEYSDIALCRCLVQAGAKVIDTGILLRYMAWTLTDRDYMAKDLLRVQNVMKNSMLTASSDQEAVNSSLLLEHTSTLANIYEHSVTAQKAVLDIRNTATDYPSTILRDIDADVFDALLQEVRQAPGFDFQRGLGVSRTGQTVFHIAAKGPPRIISSLVRLAVASGREAVASTLKTLLDSADKLGRTAFHLAAMRYGTGTNETISSFGALLQSAKRCSEILGSSWEPEKILSKPDALGVTVADYAASVAQHPDTDAEQFQEYTEELSGEWSVSQSASLGANSDRCDILELQHPVDKQTFKKLILSAQPAMFRREALEYKDRKKLKRSKFLKKHGSLGFKVGTIPYSSKFGRQEDVVTLRDFVNRTSNSNVNSSEIPPYIFQGRTLEDKFVSKFEKTPPILKDVNIVDKSGGIGPGLFVHPLQFYLGPPQSGASMHFHTNAVNILMFGRKKWFLQPPSDSSYSQDHFLIWNRSGRTKAAAQPWECMQDGGDILYVPDGWADRKSVV